MRSVRHQYYLKRWKMLEENRNNLDKNEQRMAKILFNSLSKISTESMKILKEKYYDTSTPCSFDADRKIYQSSIPMSDDSMAHKKELDLEIYAGVRREAERELLRVMKEVNAAIEKSELKLFLKVGNYYVKSIGPAETIEKIELIRYKSDAYTFDMTKEKVKKIVDQLIKSGFKCESIE